MHPSTFDQPLDQTVAVVNNDIITQSELNRTLTIIKSQLAQQNTSFSKEQLYKQALDKLIDKKLELQVATQAGISITDADLNKIIEGIAKQNNISVKELYLKLNQEGMTANEYRKEMRDQMTIQKLQQQEVVSHISITPEEVKQYTRLHRADLLSQTSSASTNEYQLEDILIPVSSSAKQQANTVLLALKSGQTIQSIVKQNKTILPINDSDLGWRSLSEIPSAFSGLVTHMQLKEIAGPIQTGNGFHIIRLVGLRSASPSSQTQTTAIPTNKEIEDILLQRKFAEAVQTWLSKLRSQAFISANA